MIDKATVQRIKDTADIVDVVGDYVHLIRRGANYMGLCPFHNERTPSFSVNRSRNFCYCFSCHKGGSPLNFLMEKEGLSYHDALIHLANRYGIKVEERELSDAEREAQTEREAMLLANDWAMKQMEHNLFNTEEGRDIGLQYFYSRGLTEEAVKKFHLGYALDKPDALTSEARKAGFDIDIFKTLGLTGTSQQGREYDRFRGRVIFPVMNSAGKVIAFGGRDLKGGLAKYINSPESGLYKKSNELYGIFQARSSIVNENRCYLVEGYMDVIGMWQSGIKNVVASSGTALTPGQINLIRRFTHNVTLIYDGDNAGIKAALRGIDLLLAHDMDINVLLLPDGHDPDSFAKAHTPEEFREFVGSHQTDIIRFKTEVLLKDIGNDPQKRVEVIRSVIESLAHIRDKIKLDVYVQTCSEILDIPSATVMASVMDKKRELAIRNRKETPFHENEAQNSDSGVSTDRPLHKLTEKADYNSQNHKVKSILQAKESGKNSFYQIEKKIMEYCIRYGFVNFCEISDTEGKKSPITVLDYITEEMNADSTVFSTEIFSKIFSLLHGCKDDFRVSLDSRILDIDSEIDKRREKLREEIMMSGKSLSEIEKAERKAEEELEIFRNNEILEFTKDFPSKELANHEDAEVRNIVNELINERHVLSNIYLKDQSVETEEDKLEILVPRVMTELKSEVLNQRLNSLMHAYREALEKGDEEQISKIQMELVSVIQLRSQVAKYIGERIISPNHP